MLPHLRNITLIGVIVLIIGSIVFIQSAKTRPTVLEGTSDIRIESINPESNSASSSEEKIILPSSQTLTVKKTTYPRAKEFVAPSGYSNTDPFLLKDVIGKKVILLDFWTYSCINCQRTIPYLNDWYAKYKDKGLVVIGVHTPEFDFEKQKDNVDRAIQKFGIFYPIVLDNAYGTWSAYKNRYWPHEYLIDIDGFIVHDHIGEGGYAETETQIQKLLMERAVRLGADKNVVLPITPPKNLIAFDPTKRISPETYFGAARNTYLSGGIAQKEGQQTLEIPASPAKDTLYLGGGWLFVSEYAQNMMENATIAYRYTAQNVYMVLGAPKTIRIKVLRDGKPLEQSAAGKDIRFEKGESVFYVNEERLYDIVGDQAGYGTHTLEFTIPSAGLQAFTFTFG